MKSLLVIVSLASLVSSVSFAMDWTTQKWTGQLDLRQQATEKDATNCGVGCTADTQTMFAAGATTMFDLGNQFALRTGGVLTQRGYKQTTGTAAAESVNYTYLDVPVLPEYQINDMFTAYAGVVVGLKASRSCGVTGGCDAISDKSLVYPMQVGGVYNIDKQWAARLTYETGTPLTSTNSTNTTELKTANAISLGGAYTF